MKRALMIQVVSQNRLISSKWNWSKICSQKRVSSLTKSFNKSGLQWNKPSRF